MALEIEVQNNKFRIVGQDFQTKWFANTAANKKTVVLTLYSLENGEGKPQFERKELESLLVGTTPRRLDHCVEYFKKSGNDFEKFLLIGNNVEHSLEMQVEAEKFRVVGEEIQTAWIPNTVANKKVILIALRNICDRRGRPIFSYQELAVILGSKNRQAASGYCEDFRKCGEDFYKTLCEQERMDSELVQAIKSILCQDPLEHIEDIARKANEILSREDITARKITIALQHVSYDKVRMSIKKALEKGQYHYKQEYLINQLFEVILKQGEKAKKAPLLSKKLEEVKLAFSPIESTIEEEKNVTDSEIFKQTEINSKNLTNAWQGPLGWKLIAFVLYYQGISLSVIGRWIGVHKSTVCRWLSEVSCWANDWVQQRVSFSGKVSIDEKWIKIGKEWWYLFAAVDCVTDYPLLVTIYPSNDGQHCKLFLSQLKLLGYNPKLIITDGWNAYPQAIRDVFPNAEHSLCIFHILKSVFKRYKEAQVDKPEAAKVIAKLFKTHYKRTVSRRLDKIKALLGQELITPVLGGLLSKLPQAQPSVGSTWRPTTTNSVERFFGKFDRFYSSKASFSNLESASKHINLFMLGYLFSINANGQACPLEKASVDITKVPFYHLINRPNLTLLKKIISQQYSNAG